VYALLQCVGAAFLACTHQGICFIAADVRGVFASVFTDFGPSFVVVDKDDTQVT
jgi:hypothetical protein